MGEQVQDGWLVGTDRSAALAAITKAFTDGERLVLLDAPAGAGRTYVAELAYSVLAHQRTGSAGRYWPERLEPGRLVPGPFTPEAGSSLEWLWLGLSGDREAAHPLHQLADQIDAHARLIRRQAAADTQWVRKWTRWALQAGGLLISGVGVGMPLDAALQALFGLAMGIDGVVEATKPLMRAGSMQRAKEFSAGWLIDASETADLSAAVAQVAEALTLIGQHIPVLIVIDDAENLDWQTVELLKSLHAAPDTTRVTVVVVASLAATVDPLRSWIGAVRHKVRWLELGSLPPLTLTELAQAKLDGATIPPVATPLLSRLLIAARGQPGILGTCSPTMRSGPPSPQGNRGPATCTPSPGSVWTTCGTPSFPRLSGTPWKRWRSSARPP